MQRWQVSPPSSGATSCGLSSCFVVVFNMSFAVLKGTPIWFKTTASDAGLHAISVSQTTGLADGQSVDVTGT